MDDTLNEIVKAFGGGGYTLHEPRDIEPRAEVAEGRALESSLSAEDIVGYALAECCMGTVKVSQLAGWVRVESIDEAPLSVVIQGDGRYSRECEHAILATGTCPLFAARADGLGVVVWLESGNARRLQEFSILSQEPAGYAEVEAPLEAFLSLIEDEWLGNLVTQYRAAPLGTVQAAALIARYGRVFSSGETLRRSVVSALTTGDLPPSPVQEWARKVSAEQRVTIAAHLRGLVGWLQDEIEALSERYAPSNPDWVAAWVRACHIRDDIEALVSLFPSLREEVRGLDEFAKDIVCAMTTGFADDLRLSHASVLDPDAWWVEPVIPPEVALERL